MAKVGTIRRRGRSWNVVIRLDGTRHEFGPKKNPELRDGVLSEKAVGEWMLRKRGELQEAAKKSAKRAGLGEPESVPFSEAVERFRNEALRLEGAGHARSLRGYSPARPHVLP